MVGALGYSITVLDCGGSKAADCNPLLIGVWKGCGNTLVALCCLPPMSVLARSTWRISAPAQPEALGDSITLLG